jgi:hypothetical protein
MELRLVAPGQDEPAAFPGFVGHAPDMGKQNRKPLDLIRKAAFFLLREESARIGLVRPADIRVFQRKIRPIRERHPGQERL